MLYSPKLLADAMELKLLDAIFIKILLRSVNQSLSGQSKYKRAKTNLFTRFNFNFEFSIIRQFKRKNITSWT